MPDWARTIARHVLYETADAIRIEQLKSYEDPELAGIAAKIEREEVYHRLHAEMWLDRLRGRGALSARRSTSSGRTRSACSTPSCGRRSPDTSARPEVDAVERGAPGRGVRRAVGGDDDGAPLGARGCAMVTAERVWEALAQIPDPEIPVISLVDLGVVKDVAVEGEHVRIAFTPTFMGCPALDAMRRQMEEAVTALGGEPEIDVLLDDSWSTDKITPAGREKLREAGFAPPAPRGAGAPTLVQLHEAVLRCPYCGSTETRLENIFGPTPCRSLRYCDSCRQPFEQFKTL